MSIGSVVDLGKETQRVRLNPDVHFTSRRFDCEQCGRPFTEELLSIDRHRRQTRRFELHIYQRCLSTSRKQVAEQGRNPST